MSQDIQLIVAYVDFEAEHVKKMFTGEMTFTARPVIKDNTNY